MGRAAAVAEALANSRGSVSLSIRHRQALSGVSSRVQTVDAPIAVVVQTVVTARLPLLRRIRWSAGRHPLALPGRD